MEHEPELGKETHRWIQEEADQYHDGSWPAAAAAILEAARTAEFAPDDPWAYLMARQHGRGGRRPKAPAPGAERGE